MSQYINALSSLLSKNSFNSSKDVNSFMYMEVSIDVYLFGRLTSSVHSVFRLFLKRFKKNVSQYLSNDIYKRCI